MTRKERNDLYLTNNAVPKSTHQSKQPNKKKPSPCLRQPLNFVLSEFLCDMVVAKGKMRSSLPNFTAT